jgi:hypothetical protein
LTARNGELGLESKIQASKQAKEEEEEELLLE